MLSVKLFTQYSSRPRWLGKMKKSAENEFNQVEQELFRQLNGKQEKELENIFNSLLTGIILVDPDTHTIVDANSVALEIIGSPREQVIGFLCHQFICPAEVGKCPITDLKQTVDLSERILLKATGERIPVLKTVTQVRLNNADLLLESFVDITTQKDSEESLRKANRALRLLSNCNQIIIRSENEKGLLQDVCSLMIGDDDHCFAWVGYGEIENKKKIVRPVCQADFDDGYLEKIKITWDDSATGRGPTGTAIRTGKPCIARNIPTDPNYKPWRAAAVKCGYASSISLPLIGDGKTFGALNIYSKHPDAFDEAETKILTEMANDLAYGIVALRTRIMHLQAEERLREGEERLRQIIKQMPYPVEVCYPDGNVSMVNQAFLKMFRTPSEELVVRKHNVLADPLFRETGLLKDIKKAWAGQTVVIPEFALPKKDPEVKFGAKKKETVYQEITMFPVFRPSGDIWRVVIIWKDITRRKQAEVALQKSLKKLHRTMEETVYAMAKIVETKDPYTAGHQMRVAILARAIGQEMGFSDDQVNGIYMAALIHDVGKIYMPAEILSKPGRLTDIEFSHIKTHPQVGHDILRTIEFPWPIAEIVRQHHERINGSGYPAGLAEKDILLEARILGVADVVEAMVSHRPYREAPGLKEALKEIAQNKGILYESEVAKICVKLFTKKGFQFA